MTPVSTSATLYRLFDEDGVLLYVGCSTRPFARFVQHASHGRTTNWWHEVASVTFEHFDARRPALAAEKVAIEQEAPRYNVYGAGRVSRDRGRAAKVAKAQALRAQGMMLREIAAEMGSSTSTVHEWITDPDLAKAKQRKVGYRGTCEDCGRPTDGGNGRDNAPKRCFTCASAHRTSKMVWPRAAVLEAIRAWAAEHGEPPAIADWCPTMARSTLHDEERARRWELADGTWPHFQTVCRRFGTWSAAIEAAGFTPRAPHGGDGNQDRRRVAA